MNSIERRCAVVFFADLLLPLRHANLRSGTVYLDRGPRRDSYWGAVSSRTGGMEKLSGSACGAAALLGSLGSYWAAHNEPALPKLLPYLENLRRELSGAAPGDLQAKEPLTEFVYPLF